MSGVTACDAVVADDLVADVSVDLGGGVSSGSLMSVPG